jgi:hypothetical protein
VPIVDRSGPTQKIDVFFALLIEKIRADSPSKYGWVGSTIDSRFGFEKIKRVHKFSDVCLRSDLFRAPQMAPNGKMAMHSPNTFIAFRSWEYNC